MPRIFIILFFAVAIVSVVIIGDSFGQIYLSNPLKNTPSEEFIIETGEGVNQISQHLKDQEIIKSMFVFETYVWWRGLGSKFLAGNFELQKGMSYRKIVRILTDKPKQDEYDITFIEGWDIRDIGEYLDSKDIVSEENFYNVVGIPATDYRSVLSILNRPSDFSNEYDFLEDKPTYVGLEGYIFPDTYRIFSDATPEDIVRKALNNFSNKLTPDLRTEISRQGKSIFEVITLASILEQEVRNEKDKKIVADIFYKRLEAGMALQADSTVNYVTQSGRDQATYKDLEINSYFNTYKYRGLPLGPICNPGIASIKAAIYPTPNDYWFFLTTSDGQVIYSKTFEEHKENRNKYLN